MNMLLLQALIFGIVEGVTEWLPISSTGHMILISAFFEPCVSDEFMEMFFVVIQLGATLSLPILFCERMFCTGAGDFSQRSRKFAKTWGKIAAGALPCAVFGVVFEIAELESRLYNNIVVASMLLIYGVVLMFSERILRRHCATVSDVRDITYATAFKIGLFQVLSLIPGTSRSGATTVGGMACGVSREASAEFSFLLAFPLMLGASAVKVLRLIGNGYSLTYNELIMLVIGVAVSFAVSIFVIRFLLDFVKRHSFKVFGIYRIVLGLLILFFNTQI